jgi:TPR repeat protein
MYLRGEGVEQNVEKGIQLMELAASLGHSTAAFNLGALYRSGDCRVPRDQEKSRHFFLLAKQLGCELPVEDYLQ